METLMFMSHGGDVVDVFFQTVSALNYLKEEHGVIHRGKFS